MTAPGIIVVGTDFSPAAAAAVARAASLAQMHGAALHVVHVPARFLQDVAPRGEAARALERVLESLRAAGTDASGHLAERPPAAGIETVATRVGASLIVVGAGERRVLRAVRVGSVAAQLSERGPTDTLVVRASGVRAGPYEDALACVDAGSRGAERVLDAALGLSVRRLRVLHVFEPPFETKLRGAGVDDAALSEHRAQARREAERRLASLLRRQGLERERAEPLVRPGAPSEVIPSVAAELGVDVVVVGRTMSRVRAVLFGTVSRAVLRGTGADVLVAR